MGLNKEDKQHQKQTRKKLLVSGFKLEKFIDDSIEKRAYCSKCKKIKKLKKCFIAIFKSGIRFLRGKCKTCETECWKSLKKEE